MLCAESRKEMEDWIGALKSVQKWETYEVSISQLFFFILSVQNKQKIVKIDDPLINTTWNRFYTSLLLIALLLNLSSFFYFLGGKPLLLLSFSSIVYFSSFSLSFAVYVSRLMSLTKSDTLISHKERQGQ